MGFWKLSNNKQQIRNDIAAMADNDRPTASIAAGSLPQSMASIAAVICSYNS
jgi:hypothetical protein